MITIHLTAEDVSETRFAFSPLWELVYSFTVLLNPSKHVLHLPWLDQHRDRLLELDLSPLAALMRKQRGYVPDFIAPPPEGPYPDFEDELERVVSTPHDEVVREVRIAYEDGAPLPPEAQVYLDRTAEALERLGDLLRRYWAIGIGPHWPRIRAVLEGDVLYRARRLALEGSGALFSDLHPEVTWDDREGTLSIGKRFDCVVEPDGRGLVLIPLAMAHPKLLVVTDPPWQPTIAYPPRGVATLWEADGATDAEALGELVGETRAAILRVLEVPMTTSEIAARLGVTPGAVSQQLAQLRRAGVVDATRSGRGVYSSLTPMGMRLLALLTE